MTSFGFETGWKELVEKNTGGRRGQCGINSSKLGSNNSWGSKKEDVKVPNVEIVIFELAPILRRNQL